MEIGLDKDEEEEKRQPYCTGTSLNEVKKKGTERQTVIWERVGVYLSSQIEGCLWRASFC